MMKFYQKSEIWFSVTVIAVYVMVMGNLQANFGPASIYSALGMLLIVAALLTFVIRGGLAGKYGLVKTPVSREVLYFIPLMLIATVNLWFGVRLHYDPFHQAIAVVTMLLSGVAEELIFRGLLFRAMEKDGLKSAVIVSSLTFGAGHIVNLLTGGATMETLLQVLYAAAIGFAFVMVVYRTGSLIPCIVTHSVVNITAELSGEGDPAVMPLEVLFLILTAGGYAVFLACRYRKAGNEPSKTDEC